jgi:steroid 5-alpha reductase family enzyme
VIQRRTRDATAVDTGWALSLAGIAVLDATLGPGDLSQRVLIATVAGLENLRVGLLVLRRKGQEEDRRYRDLRMRWAAKGREQLTFAIFYQAQAALAAALSIPFLLASFNRGDRLSPVEWAGAALWLLAVSCESIADRQLSRFVADPSHKGKTMRSGLWRYSRHPNYFFQTLTWLAYGLIAAAAPWGWLGFVSYPLILYFVIFVTGIPPTEKWSPRAASEEFRRYKQETSPFVPWIPKRQCGGHETSA